MGDGEKRICTLRVFAHGQKWAKVGKSGQKWAKARAKRHVAPVFASPLPRPRSLLCALHTSTRAQSTLVTHAPCVRRTASDARALTRQHALARQKQGWRARVTGHWLTVGRLATGASRIRMLSNLTHLPPLMRAAFINTHVVHAIHHLRRVQRINDEQRDDSEWDDAERDDAEDSGQDERHERVRAMPHAQARRQVPIPT